MPEKKRGQPIPFAAAGHAAAILDAQLAQDIGEMLLKDAVLALRPQIETYRRRRFKWGQIAEILNEAGVPVSEAHLKHVITVAARKRKAPAASAPRQSGRHQPKAAPVANRPTNASPPPPRLSPPASAAPAPPAAGFAGLGMMTEEEALAAQWRMNKPVSRL